MKGEKNGVFKIIIFNFGLYSQVELFKKVRDQGTNDGVGGKPPTLLAFEITPSWLRDL